MILAGPSADEERVVPSALSEEQRATLAAERTALLALAESALLTHALALAW